jgi:hypothetical protein
VVRNLIIFHHYVFRIDALLDKTTIVMTSSSSGDEAWSNMKSIVGDHYGHELREDESKIPAIKEDLRQLDLVKNDHLPELPVRISLPDPQFV